MTATIDISALTDAARAASGALARATSRSKDAALEAIASALLDRSAEVLTANAEDVARARAEGSSDDAVDRLALDEARLRTCAEAVRAVAALSDPVGRVVRGMVTEDGVRATQLAVPLGVVGVLHESRPDATVDAAALALKAGNAAILSGGTAAEATNRVLVRVMRDALASADVPVDALQTVDPWGGAGAAALMRARGGIDVLIARGDAALVRMVADRARVPVVEAGAGNCHVYVDAGADLVEAEEIVMDSKTQEAGAPSAAETLLVHAEVAPVFLASAMTRLTTAGVRLHADERALAIARQSPSVDDAQVVPATEEDWAREYLSMDLAVAVVDDIDAAIAHIRRWSSGHTEAICTRSLESARRFRTGVEAAAVAVNASTRLADGGRLGLGAQAGFSTQRLHVRGPIGVDALTTTTWVIEGAGTARA